MCCDKFHRLIGVLIGATVTACAGGDLNLPNDANPARMDVVSGDGQEATVGSRLPDPLVVRLTDAATRPVAGAALVFSFQGDVPEAEIDPSSVETDSTGIASVRVRLGTTIGTQLVEARVDSDAAVDVRATFGMIALEKQGGGGGGGGGGDDDHGDGRHQGKGHDHGD